MYRYPGISERATEGHEAGYASLAGVPPAKHTAVHLYPISLSMHSPTRVPRNVYQVQMKTVDAPVCIPVRYNCREYPVPGTPAPHLTESLQLCIVGAFVQL